MEDVTFACTLCSHMHRRQNQIQHNIQCYINALRAYSVCESINTRASNDSKKNFKTPAHLTHTQGQRNKDSITKWKIIGQHIQDKDDRTSGNGLTLKTQMYADQRLPTESTRGNNIQKMHGNERTLKYDESKVENVAQTKCDIFN